jgi:hypothetical protein
MAKHQRNYESRQGSLGIKLRNTELCQCWTQFDRGDLKVYQRAIGGANRYAI